MKELKKNNYVYSVNIQEESIKRADKKAACMKILADHLTLKEIERMAHVIKNDPIKTKMAKQFLNG